MTYSFKQETDLFTSDLTKLEHRQQILSNTFILVGPVSNKPALVYVLAWRQGTIWTYDCPVHWRINTSPDFNELKYGDQD